MVKKQQKSNADKTANPQHSTTVRESAQQIWLAGLGAFAKAQEEGGKVFESLVRDGVTIQRKTQTAAEERLAEAASKMASMATDIKSKAGNPLDRLENIFEDRVAKALNKLGVPAAKDIEALQKRIDALEQIVFKMKLTVPTDKATRSTSAPVTLKRITATAKNATKTTAKKISGTRPAIKRTSLG